MRSDLGNQSMRLISAFLQCLASVLQDASYELGAIAKTGYCGNSRDQLSWATLLTDAYRHPPKRAALAVPRKTINKSRSLQPRSRSKRCPTTEEETTRLRAIPAHLETRNRRRATNNTTTTNHPNNIIPRLP